MDQHGFDLYRVQIPPEIIGLVPQSVARESTVIPVAKNASQLVVAIFDLEDRDTVEKLRFVLGREVAVTYATREAIAFALEKYYPGEGLGPSEFGDARLGG